MQIYEAKKRVLRLRVVGTIVIAASAVVFTASSLKSLYVAAAQEGGGIPIGHGIRRLISAIYPRGPVSQWLWELAPTLRPDRVISSGNCGFVFVTGWFFLGCLMIASARHLAQRITAAYFRAEETGWDQDLLAGQGRPRIVAADVLHMSINLEGKDQWHNRPLGAALLGIIIVVAGAWATLKLGLTH